MITIEFLGQCGFKISTDSISVAIDPVCNDLLDEQGNTIRHYPPVCKPEELQADYIFCSHDHIDHMAKDTLLGVYQSNEKTMFVIPEGCVKEMVSWGIDRDRILPCVDGRKMVSKAYDRELKTESYLGWCGYSASHPVHQVDEEGKNHNQVFCLEMEGKKLVHLGDTYRTEQLMKDLESIGKIDVLFPPINGRDEVREAQGIIGNLNYEEAADLAAELQVGVVIPTHFDMIKGNTEDPEKFVAYLQEKAPLQKMWVPVLGQKYTL